jgi:uncharacterized coiled-coil protein SlyX
MELENSSFPELVPIAKRVGPFVGAAIVALAGIGYAVHEHNDAQAVAAQKQTLAAQNQQVTAQLSATQSQLAALAAKVDALTTASEAKPSPAVSSSSAPAGTAPRRRAAGARQGNGYDARFNGYESRFGKMQSQLDEQGKAIDTTRGDLANTRTDLANTRTELTGSIAKTHDELVVLEKRGQRKYFEFDLTKSKDYKREGPISISLRKANDKKGYADLALIVDDRNLQQKHVNLYQPTMFYQPDSPQPVEVVINDISKNHIHGYVSAPKYRNSELAAGSDSGSNASPDEASNSGDQPPARKKLPKPNDDSGLE